jgi:hypothetical protein
MIWKRFQTEPNYITMGNARAKKKVARGHLLV